jgi:UV excision repair protein RAD23
MKLIYGGSYLEDEKTLESYNIDPTHFIVCYVKPVTNKKKKKVEEKVEEKKVEEKKVEEKKVEEKKVEEKKVEEKKVEEKHSQEFLDMVQNFIDMGFEKQSIERCLKASYGDPNRAYEYLLTGIPLNIEKKLENEENKQETESNPLENFLENQGGDKNDEQEIDLEAILQQIPNFNQIRQTIQQKPELLAPIMEKIAESSPELYQLIQQFPNEFLRIMNDKTPTNQDSSNEESFQNQNQNQQQQLVITKTEKEAIDRVNFSLILVSRTWV